MTGTMSTQDKLAQVACLLHQGYRVLLTIRSGRRTPIAEIPTPDFAVPYAAPKQVKTMADVQPMAPKKGYAMNVSSSALDAASSST